MCGLIPKSIRKILITSIQCPLYPFLYNLYGVLCKSWLLNTKKTVLVFSIASIFQPDYCQSGSVVRFFFSFNSWHYSIRSITVLFQQLHWMHDCWRSVLPDNQSAVCFYIQSLVIFKQLFVSFNYLYALNKFSHQWLFLDFLDQLGLTFTHWQLSVFRSVVSTVFSISCTIGSCVLMTPAIECRSILAIDTSIDPWSTLDRHSIDISVDTRSTSRSTDY